MVQIKFGTDGWRAIIAKEYTTDNVARVTAAVAKWLNKNYKDPKIVIGFDCRFGGPMFAEVATKVFCENGVKVLFDKHFTTTPMVSLGTVRLGAQQGIVITASHNPPTYNGYKLKADYGGPSNSDVIAQVEKMIIKTAKIPSKSLEEYEAEGLLEYIDLESLYLKEVKENFDLKKIKKSGIKIAYDAMYGAGQSVLPKILPNAELLHCEENPSFMGQAPEPLHRNLQELSKFIKKNKDITAGLANDGDADRIGLYDEKGKFIDSHHILLLLIHYLHHYKGMSGKVVTSFSLTGKVEKMCEHYGLEHEWTKIGFKHISPVMVEEDVLIGGEESGGIAVKGFIPERDGIWVGLLVFEFMATTGKSLTELIKEVYKIVGKFHFERNDLHITDELKKSIMANCAEGKYTEFGDYKVEKIETIDGYKFHFSDKEWVMIRPSGTEPVLRVYAEAPSKKKVDAVLDAVKGVLLK